MIRAVILGTGHYVPDRVVTNKDLEKLMDTSDEWIQQRSGIKERRFAGAGVGPSHLGAEASKRALENAGLKATDIDCLIFATLASDHMFPGGGVLVQHHLGISDTTIPCFDVRNQCSGYLYGLQMARSFIESGLYKRILLVGAEKHSAALEMNNRGRDVSVLFGDGAGATVIVAEEVEGQGTAARGIVDVELHSQGEHAMELTVAQPGTVSEFPWVSAEMIEDGSVFPKMNGRLVFKNACVRMPEVVRSLLNRYGLKVSDIDHLFPHQANLRINQIVARSLDIAEDKCHNNIMHYGNLSAGSIPALIDEVRLAGKIKTGDLLMLTGFGSGFTWGAALIRW